MVARLGIFSRLQADCRAPMSWQSSTGFPIVPTPYRGLSSDNVAATSRDSLALAILVVRAVGTVQLRPEATGASLRCRHPWPTLPGWIVTDMLRVSALQIGDPVSLSVLVKADDPARN